MMAEQFDAYHKWLGISPEKQPPNHYQLLAIDLFESDPDVIEAAADQRMSFLRNYQIGKQSKLSQKLLNEVSTARVTLLNPETKAAYDRQLKPKRIPGSDDSLGPPVEQLGRGPALPAPAGIKPYPVTNPGAPQIPAKSPIKKKYSWQVPVGISLVALMCLGLLVAVIIVSGSTNEADNSIAGRDEVERPGTPLAKQSSSGNIDIPSPNSTPSMQTKDGLPDATRSSLLGKVRTGLKFDGTSSLRTHLRYSGETPITIEAVVLPLPAFGTVVGNSQTSGLGLQVRSGHWSFLWHDDVAYQRVNSRRPAEFGKRNVVACVFDGRAITLFVNGELQSTTPVLHHKPSQYCLMAGADPNIDDDPEHYFKGTIESLRISTDALYSASYEPVDTFVADKSTVLLLQLDEGEGNVAYDSSSHKNHCEIVGAIWTTID